VGSVEAGGEEDEEGVVVASGVVVVVTEVLLSLVGSGVAVVVDVASSVNVSAIVVVEAADVESSAGKLFVVTAVGVENALVDGGTSIGKTLVTGIADVLPLSPKHVRSPISLIRQEWSRAGVTFSLAYVNTLNQLRVLTTAEIESLAKLLCLVLTHERPT
jgi:hypothetical protein